MTVVGADAGQFGEYGIPDCTALHPGYARSTLKPPGVRMSARAQFTFDLPKRKPDEEDLTEKQRSFIEHLLEEVDAKGFPEDPFPSLGKWQASVLIERLLEIRDGEVSEKMLIDKSSQTHKNQKAVSWTLVIVVGLFLLWLFL